MEKYIKEFEEIYSKHIKREGADKMLEYLRSTDFFTAPASTRFHGNFKGGLVEHCVRVYNRFYKILENEYGAEYFKKEGVQESIAIIALLHDVCKINCYKTELRNVKEDGNWVQKPYFAYQDPLPYGHGEKSVYMISAYMRLTRDEAMAINWHMGAFDARAKDSNSTLNVAYKQYPLALLFHSADMLSSYLDEETVK
ncbi:MAG: hydrolase [Firmicutes bacterium]|nr:hydrolase [Bacillota bacterium]